MNEGLLSVKNASGRQVSLLNNNDEQTDGLVKTPTSPTSFSSSADEWQQDAQQSKRKYHCIEPGCNKSFTTSGHLARHNRIHTGEKNFPCLFPGCQSRFSRQDNMMQHYRTHMSPKSRRSQKRGLAEEPRPRPRLHAHHRIRSDPVRVEPPLTIDQHLSNYHQSLTSVTTTHERYTPVRFNFPLPLSSTARSSSNLKKVISPPQQSSVSQLPQLPMQQNRDRTPSPTLSHSSSSASLPSIHHIIDDSSNPASRPTSPPKESFVNEKQVSPDSSPSNSTTTTTTTTTTTNLFYQHRPLTFTRPQNSSFPYTLLHPAQQQEEQSSHVARNQTSGNYKPSSDDHQKEDPMDEDKDNNNGSNNSTKSPSSGGLLQLAHIVSTFG